MIRYSAPPGTPAYYQSPGDESPRPPRSLGKAKPKATSARQTAVHPTSRKSKKAPKPGPTHRPVNKSPHDVGKAKRKPTSTKGAKPAATEGERIARPGYHIRTPDHVKVRMSMQQPCFEHKLFVVQVCMHHNEFTSCSCTTDMLLQFYTAQSSSVRNVPVQAASPYLQLLKISNPNPNPTGRQSRRCSPAADRHARSAAQHAGHAAQAGAVHGLPGAAVALLRQCGAFPPTSCAAWTQADGRYSAGRPPHVGTESGSAHWPNSVVLQRGPSPVFVPPEQSQESPVTRVHHHTAVVASVKP